MSGCSVVAESVRPYSVPWWVDTTVSTQPLHDLSHRRETQESSVGSGFLAGRDADDHGAETTKRRGRNIVISKKKGPVSTIRAGISQEDAHAGKKLVVNGSAI